MTTTSAADLSVWITLPTPSIRVDHTFAAGSTTAVVGPNGAGKTTLLRAIAGLLNGGESRIALGDELFHGRGRPVPVHRRGIALLGQDAGLFPHLSVRANVAFAPASQRLPRREVTLRVDRWLDALDVVDLADRKPAQLSGGQAQRVAIARALAAQPRVLLLDEPFRALDVDVAARLRALLRDLLADRSRTTLIVTHDVVDAVGLADDIMVIESGRVVQSGPTREVLSVPASRFAASLSGLNLFVGELESSNIVVDAVGNRVVGTAREELDAGKRGAAVFAPRSVAVYADVPHGSPRTVLPGTVTDLAPSGDHALVACAVGGQSVQAEVTWDAVADLDVRIGASVYLVVKASEVGIYGSAGGAELPRGK
ncbi:sulfate/molybdate ABC transporter ATP-binding protein [Gordonia bronchialis]|uniref:sulfate/molybdate ABC transporter ATP-binding protein n=1 Tax=Gordonia bronchialis TaxID=2054 RepID=UPI0024320150|nr:ABC transporter ATP-binding protein [Gordonia bronchialis]